jgi:hypothetical protein
LGFSKPKNSYGWIYIYNIYEDWEENNCILLLIIYGAKLPVFYTIHRGR